MGGPDAPRQLGSLSYLSVSDTVTIPFPTKVYADKLNTLKAEFSRRFADFGLEKFNLDLFANPFAIDVDTSVSARRIWCQSCDREGFILPVKLEENRPDIVCVYCT
jgi:hypothetical protein